MRILLLFMICIAMALPGSLLKAQTLSLDECIRQGVQSNLEVRQAELAVRENKIYWNGARAALLPTLNASTSSGINTGRSIDPFTNSYITEEIRYSSYGANSNLVLFNGLSLQNTVKQTRQIFEAAGSEAEQIKDNLAIDITLAYLEALSNEELMAQWRVQAELSLEQVKRLEKMNLEGAISPYLLTDLKGQYANDQIAIINARNNWELSKINLFRLINVPYSEKIRLQKLDSNFRDAGAELRAEDVYRKAEDALPMIRAARLRQAGALSGWKAARGRLLPVLSFGASANTNYSSAAELKYGPQLDNNLFKSFSLNLNVPLFNGFVTRYRMKVAELAYENTSILATTTQTRLQQAVEEAVYQLRAAAERLQTVQEQVDAYQESFRSATIRFNEGVINSVDYLTAKNNLDRANITLITARYDYSLRQRIIAYYNGEAIR